MVTNATTIKQISIFNRPRTDICLLVPRLWKSGGTIFFFCFVPQVKIRRRSWTCPVMRGCVRYTAIQNGCTAHVVLRTRLNSRMFRRVIYMLINLAEAVFCLS